MRCRAFPTKVVYQYRLFININVKEKSKQIDLIVMRMDLNVMRMDLNVLRMDLSGVGPSLPENLDFQRLAQPQLCGFIFTNTNRKVGVAQNSRQRLQAMNS